MNIAKPDYGWLINQAGTAMHLEYPSAAWSPIEAAREANYIPRHYGIGFKMPSSVLIVVMTPHLLSQEDIALIELHIHSHPVIFYANSHARMLANLDESQGRDRAMA